MTWSKELDELAEKLALARAQGGEAAVAKQHAKGRLTIRERIDGLVDPASFRELGAGAGGAERDDEGKLSGFSPANFVLGFAKLAGRLCVVGGEDFTLKGGSPNEAGLRKSVYAEELACQYRVPLVRLHEGGGGSVSGSGSKTVGSPVFQVPRFRSVARALASVPVASAALGPVAGLPASRLVASHFSVMTKDAQVLVAGPAVVERALGKRKSKEELGGPEVHTKNGVVDNLAEDEAEAFAQIRQFLSYLPQNVSQLAPVGPCDDSRERREEGLLKILPRDRRRVYDMRQILALVLDRGSFFEMSRFYGAGLIVGLARLAGQPVGIFANDCTHYAGAMTAEGAQKLKRLITLCETFHLPIVTFVDEPGFMIGAEAERAGTIRYGTETVMAVADCPLPWASVLVRRAFGVATYAHFAPGAYVLAWPSAEYGALPVEGGVAVAFGREIAAAKDPQARRRELEAALANQQSIVPRAESFSVHDLIDPRDTRPLLCDWIERVQPLLPGMLGVGR